MGRLKKSLCHLRDRKSSIISVASAKGHVVAPLDVLSAEKEMTQIASQFI